MCLILANSLITWKRCFQKLSNSLLYFQCPALNSNLKWILTIPSIIHWRGEEDTHLFILKWLDSLKYGDLTSGFCYNQKLAMKSEKKESLLKSKTHQKWSMYVYSKVPCKLFQKNKVHIWILKCIGLKNYSTSSI